MTKEHAAGDPLRARNWGEFIGQEEMKKRLEIHVEGARKNGRMLSHVLFTGPPGFGKTTLANIIAARLGDDIISFTWPVKITVLAKLFRTWGGGVLLLDEIHRGSKTQKEELLSVLLDGKINLPNGRVVTCPPLTVIGATTEPENVIPPLYDRFKIKPTFVPYTDEEMARIMAIMARKLEVALTDDTCLALGRAAGGVPRNLTGFAFAAEDLHTAGLKPTAEAIMDLCDVDPTGLTARHIQYLECLHALDGKAGLSVLSAMLRLHPNVIQGLERLLIEQGLLIYGDRGRELTDVGYRRLDGPTTSRIKESA
jgi:Holliday junction DNA helicase RuvB